MSGRVWLITFLAAGCGGAAENLTPLRTVEHVDLQRYLGTWYEIARYPNSFQEDCHGSTADYRLRSDGDIRVLNACRTEGPDGPLEFARGKAWITDAETNARLRVSFFWPFAGDYWIIDLGENYEYAVVGMPSRKYLWILARRPTMKSSTFQRILERLPGQGYDPRKLVRDEGSVQPDP